MRQIEELQKQWRESVRFRSVHASMSLEKDGLVLGAKTVLAKRNRDGALALEGAEAQLLALLAVAYGHPIDAAVLGKIRRASKHAQAGDECMAAMHIALAGLSRLPDPSAAARRLFIADGLLRDGVTPRDIFAVLEFDSTPLDELEKYDPNQPRVPAGSGRASGQWTIGGALAFAEMALEGIGRAGAQWANGEAVREFRARVVQALEQLPKVLPETLRIASRAAGPVAFATELLDSPDLGGSRVEGAVRDFPDLRYSRHQDETALQILRASDGHVVFTMYPRGRGIFVDPVSGVVAHVEDDELVVGAPAVPVPQVRAQARTQDPDLCPNTTNDWRGRVGLKGEKDKDYEDHIKRIDNPDDPTPRGMGYKFPDPFRPRYPVIYDDCQHETGDLIEAKGTGYAAMLAKPDGFMAGVLTRRWLRQAENQVNASEGRQLIWYFAEKDAADYARRLFARNPKLENIWVIYEHWREGVQ